MIRGAASARPSPGADPDAWFSYIYLRENPRGSYEEHWHHTSGCRRWLVVSRDTVTHETRAVWDVADKSGVRL